MIARGHTLAVGGLVVALAGLIALLIGDSTELRQPIMLAVVGPMSGPAAFQGQAMADAARLAVEQANASACPDSRPIELHVFDDRS